MRSRVDRRKREWHKVTRNLNWLKKFRDAKLYVFLLCFLSLVPSCERKSGTEPSQGDTPRVTSTEIFIGSSLALGGHASYLGTETLRGALSYINHVNERGGVHGRKIRVIA